MAGGHVNRSSVRSVNVAFRLSPEDRDELKVRAARAGLSVQAYLEKVALDRDDAHDRQSGRPRLYPQPEELPLQQPA
jgi:hypothetical protein